MKEKGSDERGMGSSGEERCEEKGEAAGENKVRWLGDTITLGLGVNLNLLLDLALCPSQGNIFYWVRVIGFWQVIITFFFALLLSFTYYSAPQ